MGIRSSPTKEQILAWKEKFLAVFRYSLGGVCFYSQRDGRIVDVNERFLQITGYQREDIHDRVIQELHFWADPAQEGEYNRRLNEEGVVQDFECLIHRKNGENLCAFISAATIEISGEPYILVEGIDSAGRKEADAALIDQNRRQCEAPLGYFRTTSNGIILEANQVLADLLGYASPQEFTGRNIASFYVNGLDQPPTGGCMQEVELRLARRDGHTFWARQLSWVTGDAQGKPQFVEYNLIDIDQRKQMEVEENRRREELEIITRVSTAMRAAQCRVEIYAVLAGQLSHLLHAQGVAIIVRDEEESLPRIELGYQAWQAWTGSLVQPADRLRGQVAVQGRPLLINGLYKAGGSDMDVYGDVTCLAGVPLVANQQIIGGLFIGRMDPILPGDMHVLTAIGDMAANAIQRERLRENLQTQLEALHEAQTRLVQSEKLAAIGSLVAGVAHELNNPLTTVLLFSQMIQQRSISEDIQVDLDRIIFAARQANNIVRSLLDFARQRAPERKPVQINDVLQSSLDFLAHELSSQAIQWEIHIDPNLPISMADPHQLHQVFINLIQNACQAMAAAHGSGHLIATTEAGKPRYLTAGASSRPVIRIGIRDDGPGMTADTLSRIFDPFFTTKPAGSGTGLGLAVCHGIITEHQGHIWAESEEGQGAVFYVELPIVKIVAPAFEAAASAPEASPSGAARILLIEDEQSIQEVICRALERRGYSIDVRSSGTDGLQAIQRGTYDLILSDMHLPGLSGPDLYRQAVQMQAGLARRFIFMSGDTISRPYWSFLEETGVALLTKPFDLGDLYGKVKAILDAEP